MFCSYSWIIIPALLHALRMCGMPKSCHPHSDSDPECKDPDPKIATDTDQDKDRMNVGDRSRSHDHSVNIPFPLHTLHMHVRGMKRSCRPHSDPEIAVGGDQDKHTGQEHEFSPPHQDRCLLSRGGREFVLFFTHRMNAESSSNINADTEDISEITSFEVTAEGVGCHCEQEQEQEQEQVGDDDNAVLVEPPRQPKRNTSPSLSSSSLNTPNE